MAKSQESRRATSRKPNSSPTKVMIPTESPIDKSRAKKLEQFRCMILSRHERCVDSAIKMVEKFVCCGETLAHAKKFVGHGDFRNWLEANFQRETGLGNRTAQRYLGAYRGFIQYLKETNSAPAAGSLTVVTSNKEILHAYCHQVILRREIEAKTKRNGAQFNVPPEVLAAVGAIFGFETFTTTQVAEESDLQQDWPGKAFIDARQLQLPFSVVEKLLAALDARELEEAIIWLPFTSLPLPEQLWHFPIAIRPLGKTKRLSAGAMHNFRSECGLVSSVKGNRQKFSWLSDFENFFKRTSPGNCRAISRICSRPLSLKSIGMKSPVTCLSMRLKRKPNASAMRGENDMTDVIYSYTRREAIADGVLVDVSRMAQECGFRFPVAVTRTVWELCVSVPPSVVGQDEKGRLWDLLWMLRCSIALSKNASWVSFLVSVRNDNHAAQPISLRGNCGPGDEGEPVITILMPDED